MFRCHSPKSSHSLPLPQSPKDCYIHQCLFAVDDPEGWYGEGGGQRVPDGKHMFTCGGFILICGKLIQYCKVKNKNNNNNKPPKKIT